MMGKQIGTSDSGMKIVNKSKLLVSFVLFLSLCVAVVSVSAAWMSISRTPLVSDLGLTVLTESRLELAPDIDGKPGEWDVVLDLSETLQDLSPLKPVTYSKEDESFFAMNYGEDGRGSGIDIALTDEKNANVKSDGKKNGTEDGYYIAVTFWMRAPSTATIYLSEAKAVDEGLAGSGTYVVGNPVWDGKAIQHKNGGNGLETALRLGLRCTTTDAECTPLDDPVFYIYEPNADTHVNGSTGYLDTYSMNGGAGLVEDEFMIIQSTSSWDETTPVLSSDVVYELGEFMNNPHLFEIKGGELKKITLYVWLEGNDVDCVNQASADPTSILANIQFTSDYEEIDTGIERDE